MADLQPITRRAPSSSDQAAPSSSTAIKDVSLDRRVQQTISLGALGGGILLAGFGLAPALVGMTAGMLLAYWVERRIAASRPAPAQ